MKLNYTKEWYEQHIETEGDVEVGAGVPFPQRSAERAAEPRNRLLDTRIAFGQFVGLWRRNKGWNAVKLATEAGIDPVEILEIEHDPQCEPEPDAVFKLAGVFGVPTRTLLELAGLVECRSSRLRETPPRHGARSESMAALSDEEREALESVLATLNDETGG